MQLHLTPLHKEEQGLGHLLVVVLIVVVLAVVGGAGYEVYKANNKPKASTNSTTVSSSAAVPATDAACLTIYHDNNLCKFAEHANFNSMPYKATMTVVSSGATSTWTTESDGKGNTSSSITGNGVTIGTIELDGDDYIQSTAGGTWYEYPSGSTSPSTDTNPLSGVSLAVGSTTTYKPLGTGPCGNLTCFEYSVSESSTPGTTLDVWFDTSHYLLREMKSTDASGNTFDATFTYPSSVTISKPSPVQSYTDLTE